MNKLTSLKSSVKTKNNSKSKKDSPKRKNITNSIESESINISNILSEVNKDYQENKNNFSYITNTNINRTVLTDVNKEKEYKEKILQLEKEIEKEKDISKLKSKENKQISDIYQKIKECQREIKLYANKNNKQREQLQLLSQEIGKKLDSINFKSIKKQMIKENNEKKNERDMVEVCIENKQKQLQNIVSLIEILENENDTLKKKIKKGKNMNKYYELVENQKNQENKINELNKEIKMKKVELKEHSKCEGIKSELMKKIEAIKEEINMNYGKNTQLKKKLEILENKKKEKEEKEEKLQKKDYKPIIVLSKNMNNINYYRNNNSLNIGYNAKTEENLNKTSKKQRNKDKSKNEGENDNDNNINNNLDNDKTEENKTDNNNNNVGKNNLEKKTPKKTDLKRESFNKIIEKEMINIPSNITEMFTENELKAILIGLDKNKSKYNNLLRKINIDNTYIDTMENKHRLNIKNKLKKINELDEKIEFLYRKNNENEADFQLYKKQIDEVVEIKKMYNMKVNQINNQVEEKRKVIERKNKEIKILKIKLSKLKKLMRNGDIKNIKNESEIEVQYLDDEEEENNIINNKTGEKEGNINKKKERDVETPQTEGTGYEEDNENNVKDIKIKNDNFNKFYYKEEHISGNNSFSSSKNS